MRYINDWLTLCSLNNQTEFSEALTHSDEILQDNAKQAEFGMHITFIKFPLIFFIISPNLILNGSKSNNIVAEGDKKIVMSL